MNGGAAAAGMFGAVTVDIERSALGELGVDVADSAGRDAGRRVLAAWTLGRLLPTRRKARRAAGSRAGRVLRHGAALGRQVAAVSPNGAACGRCVCRPGHLGPRDH
ncbi:MAG: hypothetical protein ACLU0O_00490 [Collinsella sp.]